MLTIRPFTEADVNFGMQLKDQAKWNQMPADWRRCVALEPEGCFVGLWNGTPAATLTTCLFDQIAWIAMVLTDPEYRGRGIASGLMRHAVAYLEQRGAESIRLDATEFGLPVYEKLGFQVDWRLTRYGGWPTIEASAGQAPIQRLGPDQFDAVVAADRQVTATNRRRLLERLVADDAARSLCIVDNANIAGYCLERPGSRATQIGPCIAAGEDAGCRLLAAACRDRDRVYIDIPDENTPARRWATDALLTAERRFYRMTLGKPVTENQSAIWASFGPEKG